MKPIVYIETSIPSFYREWWDQYRTDYMLVTSEAVLEELETGEYPGGSVCPYFDDAISINRRCRGMKDDPTIARIRAVRHQISKQYQHDTQRIIDHYIAREQQHQRRFLDVTDTSFKTKPGKQEGVKVEV